MLFTLSKDNYNKIKNSEIYKKWDRNTFLNIVTIGCIERYK